MKLTLAVVLALSLAAFSACNKSKSPDQPQNATPSSSKSDAVQQKLQELAGSGASDCGSPKSQQPADVEPASKCAMQAAQNKQAFYVRYDLPGMTTAMAGDASRANSTPCSRSLAPASKARPARLKSGRRRAVASPATHQDRWVPWAAWAAQIRTPAGRCRPRRVRIRTAE